MGEYIFVFFLAYRSRGTVVLKEQNAQLCISPSCVSSSAPGLEVYYVELVHEYFLPACTAWTRENCCIVGKWLTHCFHFHVLALGKFKHNLEDKDVPDSISVIFFSGLSFSWISFTQPISISRSLSIKRQAISELQGSYIKDVLKLEGRGRGVWLIQ